MQVVPSGAIVRPPEGGGGMVTTLLSVGLGLVMVLGVLIFITNNCRGLYRWMRRSAVFRDVRRRRR